MPSGSDTAQRSYLFLDESGHAGAGAPDDHHREYLALVGCVVHHDDYVSQLRPAFDLLRNKHFPSVSPTPCFHRADIMRLKGPFVILNNPTVKQVFDRDLLALFRSQAYRVIAPHGG